MKPQKRDFVIEIKKKRRHSGIPKPSIWKGIDLADHTENALNTTRTTPQLSDIGATSSSKPVEPGRILPTIAKPAVQERPEIAAVLAVNSTPDGDEALDDGAPVSGRRTRCKRSRRLANRPLIAGQRWKGLLPRIHQYIGSEASRPALIRRLKRRSTRRAGARNRND